MNRFITGPGGTGKTYMAKKLAEDSKHMYLVAPTGAAAIQLGGTTLHSLLGLQLFKGTIDTLVNAMLCKPKLVHRWCTMETLLIDEISMVDVGLFVRASEVVKRVRMCALVSQGMLEAPEVNMYDPHIRMYPQMALDSVNTIHMPWGGIRLILVGDFLQLPPVETYSHYDELTGITYCYTYLFEHPIWDEMQLNVTYLTKPYRYEGSASSDLDYVSILNDIRMGIASTQVKTFLKQCIDRPMPEQKDGEMVVKPTMLIATNAEVDGYNQKHLDAIEEEGHIYTGKARIMKGVSMNKHMLDEYVRKCMAPEHLVLKVGAQVMLLRNMLDKDLCNGSRGVVTGFDRSGAPIVKFLNGTVMTISKNRWTNQDNMGNVLCTYIQIPLRLAWSITVHKAQGMTLDYVHLCIDTCFAPGQLYVSLSRCRSIDGTFIQKPKNGMRSIWDRCMPNPKAISFYQDLVANDA